MKPIFGVRLNKFGLSWKEYLVLGGVVIILVLLWRKEWQKSIGQSKN